MYQDLSILRLKARRAGISMLDLSRLLQVPAPTLYNQIRGVSRMPDERYRAITRIIRSQNARDRHVVAEAQKQAS